MVATPFGLFASPSGDPIALAALLAVLPLVLVRPWQASIFCAASIVTRC